MPDQPDFGRQELTPDGWAGTPASPSPAIPSDANAGMGAHPPSESTYIAPTPPPPPAPATGWQTSPPGRQHTTLIWGCLIVGLVAGIAIIAIFVWAFGTMMATERSGVNGPTIVAVGVGTGRSDCDLTGQGTTFQQGTPIHVVMTMSPALPAGGTVTTTLEIDGNEIDHNTVTATEASDSESCLWTDLPDPDVGHYRLTIETDPSTLPPTIIEFEVTS